MIHLFNKIYLKGDHQIKLSRDRIVISPTYGGVGMYTTKFTTLVNKETPGEIQYSVRSLQELLDQHFNGSMDGFFRFLAGWNSSKRLTIYADIPTMIEIASVFYKTLFPKMTADGYVCLIRLILMRITYMFGAGFLTFTKIPEFQAKEYRLAAVALLENVSDLKTKWTTIKPFRLSLKLREQIVSGISVEFQLATYLLDPTWRFKVPFEKKALTMVKKLLLHDFMLDVNGVLLQNFVTLGALEPQANFNPLTDTLEDFVTKCPDYKFLIDEQFLPDNADKIWLAYDVTKLAAIRNKMYAQADLQNNAYVHLTTPVWKRNVTFADVITYELSTNHTKLLFKHDNYAEVVNSYLIDLLLNAKRQGDTTFLKQFALV